MDIQILIINIQLINFFTSQSAFVITLFYNQYKMDFRTKKCNHGQRARCINCLAQQLKTQKKIEQQIGKTQQKQKCFHPPNMKCLKCISTSTIKKEGNKCTHSSFERCANCKKQQNYETFQYFVQKLANDCKHKKPCKKCVPPQSRKTFGVDLECRNHLPYPQAQCDACMAPTLTIQKQPYSHVKKVVIRTTSVHRIIDANLFGILLGYQKDDIIYIEDIFFPEEQIPKGNYLSPQILHKYGQIFDLLGYTQVGLIYSSTQITAMGLMLSSMFQEQCIQIDKNGYQISKFITMRLHWDQSDPYFQCFMVSDLFQIFHRNNLIFQKNNNKDYFDLITAKGDKNDKFRSMPTFLREGIQTQQFYFKQIIVWIQTVSQENFFWSNKNLLYPFFMLEEQKIDDMEMFLSVETLDPIDKYRNVQFLLHMYKLFGLERVLLFLNSFIYDDPQLFITENLNQIKRRQRYNKSQSHDGFEKYY